MRFKLKIKIRNGWDNLLVVFKGKIDWFKVIAVGLSVKI
jgi:hypothetical protein